VSKADAIGLTGPRTASVCIVADAYLDTTGIYVVITTAVYVITAAVYIITAAIYVSCRPQDTRHRFRFRVSGFGFRGFRDFLCVGGHEDRGGDEMGSRR
jgi:hypothetical protein